MAVSVVAEEWTVSEEGSVSAAAVAVVALADREEVVDMVEMVVLKAAAMELALEVCMVDQEVDMAAEAADSAVDDSGDATQD